MLFQCDHVVVVICIFKTVVRTADMYRAMQCPSFLRNAPTHTHIYVWGAFLFKFCVCVWGGGGGGSDPALPFIGIAIVLCVVYITKFRECLELWLSAYSCISTEGDYKPLGITDVKHMPCYIYLPIYVQVCSNRHVQLCV